MAAELADRTKDFNKFFCRTFRLNMMCQCQYSAVVVFRADFSIAVTTIGG